MKTTFTVKHSFAIIFAGFLFSVSSRLVTVLTVFGNSDFSVILYSLLCKSFIIVIVT